MDSRSLLLVCVTAALLGAVCSQTTACMLPDENQTTTLITTLTSSSGGEAGEIEVLLLTHRFTCIAVGTAENTITSLSIAATYNLTNSDGTTTLQRQFQLRCSGSSLVSGTTPIEFNPPAEAFTAETRRDCFTCAVDGSDTIDPVTNCAACPSECREVGQGSCTANNNDSCCPFYEEGVCTKNCTANRVANSTTNVCVCREGFVENVDNTMCVHVCDSSPCQNGGSCTAVGSIAVCTCPPEYTGMTCKSDITPVTPTPTAMPSPTPTPTPTTNRPCPDNCRECDSAGCCTQCEASFEKQDTCSTCVPTVCSEGCDTCFNSTCCRMCEAGYQLVIEESSCRCNLKPTDPSVCSVENCANCSAKPSNSGRPCCAVCQPGYTLDTDECLCNAIRVTDSAALAAGIAVGVVLLVLFLLAVALLAAYLIYAFVTHGTNSKRAKTQTPFGSNGDAHDNPLYINPKEFDDEDEP